MFKGLGKLKFQTIFRFREDLKEPARETIRSLSRVLRRTGGLYER